MRIFSQGNARTDGQADASGGNGCIDLNGIYSYGRMDGEADASGGNRLSFLERLIPHSTTALAGCDIG